MLRTLIVEDDINYVMYIINTILNRIKEIHITNIATTIADAINIVKNNNIDLIFLDLKLPDATGIELINKINMLNFVNKPNIIILSGKLSLIREVKYEYNLSIINKIEDTGRIFNKIKQVTNDIKYLKNKSEINNRIFIELSNIGYNFKYKGTHYIYDSIIYIYESNNLDLLNNLEKNVYKYIAHKYKKSVNNIKTNIIKATNLIQTDTYTSDTLTPKIVITNLLIKLIQDY